MLIGRFERLEARRARADHALQLLIGQGGNVRILDFRVPDAARPFKIPAVGGGFGVGANIGLALYDWLFAPR